MIALVYIVGRIHVALVCCGNDSSGIVGRIHVHVALVYSGNK